MIEKNLYRETGLGVAHVRTFKASQFRKIKLEDFKDKNGEWYTLDSDVAIFNPILEMSCGRIYYLH